MKNHEISTLRAGLPPIPSRLAKLRTDHRGYPVPWFVADVDGKPDFRVMDGNKLPHAVRFRKCWICGEQLGRWLTFLIGPMCAITRTIAEPPSHHDCAEWSAKVCPFLTLPKATRRDNNLPAEGQWSPTGIKRNPGAVLLWTTDAYKVFKGHGGEPLFSLGEPSTLEWYAQGRIATRAEILESIESGLPLLMQTAEAEGEEAVKGLNRAVARGMALVPAA